MLDAVTNSFGPGHLWGAEICSVVLVYQSFRYVRALTYRTLIFNPGLLNIEGHNKGSKRLIQTQMGIAAHARGGEGY